MPKVAAVMCRRKESKTTLLYIEEGGQCGLCL